MERAGMPWSVAMRISGHKTEAVYRRYDIVSERDLREARVRMERFFDGKKAAFVTETGANTGTIDNPDPNQGEGKIIRKSLN